MADETPSSTHWNTFYKLGQVPELPSQFAVFMLGEQSGTKAVVEFGCGNGRDSLFFARHGCRVVGVDASQSGIEACQKKASEDNLDAHFFCCDVSSYDAREEVVNLLDEVPETQLIVYARFFLHAITEDAERAMLQHAHDLLSRFPGVLGVEFRTHRDSQQKKVTPTHYRRFIDPAAFVARASRNGFSPIYSAEGFGMAKYREDDAHVARFILAVGG